MTVAVLMVWIMNFWLSASVMAWNTDNRAVDISLGISRSIFPYFRPKQKAGDPPPPYVQILVIS
jgi:hypothetical protein